MTAKWILGLIAAGALLDGTRLLAQSDPAAPPPFISIRPSRSPEERARLAAQEGERRAALRRDLAAWLRLHEPALQPLRRTLDEALRSLRISWGPYSRNLGYNVKLEIGRLRGGLLPPLPDPALQAAWESALAEIEEGADLCLARRPTGAQTRLEAGWRKLEQALAGAEEILGPHRLFEPAPCGPGCAGVTRPGRRTTAAPARPEKPGRPPLKVPSYPRLRRRP
ncbi:MAG TPA: hypothetical protein VHU81_11505 [Thermoanaerobaculia bacterium]|jgi:hypothetical protein|nr:hypothetical protein [Thermoanaerobaculia bacterium]